MQLTRKVSRQYPMLPKLERFLQTGHARQGLNPAEWRAQVMQGVKPSVLVSGVTYRNLAHTQVALSRRR